jgi:hypothetical protein
MTITPMVVFLCVGYGPLNPEYAENPTGALAIGVRCLRRFLVAQAHGSVSVALSAETQRSHDSMVIEIHRRAARN